MLLRRYTLSPARIDTQRVCVKKVVDEQYFQNYLTDPRRILPSMPEAKLPSRPEVCSVKRMGIPLPSYVD